MRVYYDIMVDVGENTDRINTSMRRIQQRWDHLYVERQACT